VIEIQNKKNAHRRKSRKLKSTKTGIDENQYRRKFEKSISGAHRINQNHGDDKIDSLASRELSFPPPPPKSVSPVRFSGTALCDASQ